MYNAPIVEINTNCQFGLFIAAIVLELVVAPKFSLELFTKTYYLLIELNI